MTEQSHMWLYAPMIPVREVCEEGGVCALLASQPSLLGEAPGQRKTLLQMETP